MIYLYQMTISNFNGILTIISAKTRQSQKITSLIIGKKKRKTLLFTGKNKKEKMNEWKLNT